MMYVGVWGLQTTSRPHVPRHLGVSGKVTTLHRIRHLAWAYAD